MEEVSWKIVSWCPILQIVILSIGTLICFLIAYHLGDVTVYLPFISETGAKVPEMSIFTFITIMGSFTGIIVVIYRYLIILHMIEKDSPYVIYRRNRNACICGVVSMIGLAGVAAFPMSTVFIVHIIFAGIHFAFAMFYLILQSYLTYKVKLESDSLSSVVFKIRIVLTILVMIFLGLLVVCMPIAYLNWLKHHQRLHALKTPVDIGFNILFASALFEWLFYITFLIYILSLVHEFRKFELIVFVRTKQSKAMENMENKNLDNDKIPKH